MEDKRMATTAMKIMRVSAKHNHTTYAKVDRLIRFLRAEELELSFYKDRIFVRDVDNQVDKDWEIVNLQHEFINELPTDKYKLERDAEYDVPKVRASMEPKDFSPEVIDVV
jgi:hypothetical protein